MEIKLTGLAAYIEVCKGKNCGEILKMVNESMGYNAVNSTVLDNILRVIRIYPYLMFDGHMMEVSGGSTGKSSISEIVFRNYSMVLTRLSPSDIFGDASSKGTTGLINQEYSVIHIDEGGEKTNTDITNDNIALFKGYTDGYEVDRRGLGDKSKLRTSLIVSGNLEDKEIASLNKSPYNYNPSVLRVLPESFVTQPFLERFFILPSFAMSKIKIFMGTPEISQKDFTDMIYSMRHEAKRLDLDKNNIEERDIKIISKLYSFIKTMFPCLGKEDEEGLNDIINSLLKLKTGKYEPIYNTTASKKLLVKFLTPNLDFGIEEIEYVIFKEHRVLIKRVGIDKYYKLALSKYGVDENVKEMEFYKTSEDKEHIAKIFSLSDNKVILIQDYYPLLNDEKNKIEVNPMHPAVIKEKFKKLELENLQFKRDSKKTNETLNYLIKALIFKLNGQPVKLPELLDLPIILETIDSSASESVMEFKINRKKVLKQDLGIFNNVVKIVDFANYI